MTNLPNPFPGKNSVKINVQLEDKIYKAGKNGTLIAAVLDASGSMAWCLDQTLEGFNGFVAKQKQEKNIGDAFLTLVQFSSPSLKTTFENVNIQTVPTLTNKEYYPSGGTNLFDAIGSTIKSTNAILSAKKKKDRPAVLILIMTDGEENASLKYNNESIKALVKQAEDKEWTFMFLGANIDAFAVGSSFGMNVNNSFNYNVGATTSTFAAMSASASTIRGAKMNNVSNQTLYASSLISDEDKAKMENK